MKDPRKAKALARARMIYASHLRLADDYGVVAFLHGNAPEREAVERALIESIATAIYDAATTGHV